MASLFIPFTDYVKISIKEKVTLMTGFVLHGHICTQIVHGEGHLFIISAFYYGVSLIKFFEMLYF